MRGARRSVSQIFALPTLIAFGTLVGLIAGLIGSGASDAAAWLALAIPLAAIGWALARSSGGGAGRH